MIGMAMTKEEISAYKSKRYFENKDRIKKGRQEYCKIYSSINRDKIRCYQRKYREENKELTSAKAKAWAKKNSVIYKERQKSYYEREKENILRRWREKYNNRKDYESQRKKEYRLKHWEKCRKVERLRREKNKEKMILVQKVWKAANKQKVLHTSKMASYRRRWAKGCHSINEWRDMLNSCLWKCCMCWANNVISKDHIIPISKWWTNNIYNIQPLCGRCNSSKHTKIQVWYIVLELFELIKINPLTLVSLCV